MRLIALLLIAVCGWRTAAAAHDVGSACDAAAVKAERDWNVPAGVLSAVGSVESGRQGGPLGPAPWPWTINAAGRGFYFETKQEAIAAVLEIMTRGFPYIDVGCFQIDIAYHSDVFRSLEDAFDPERNAQAAARLLLTERSHVSDWATAVAHYHSATPEHGNPYLQRVRSALPAAKLRGQTADVLANWPPSEPAAAATLPKVIYPPTSPRSAREPQIVYIGDPKRLPSVITTENQNRPAPR